MGANTPIVVPFVIQEARIMPRCETCGNDYENSFEITMDGESHTFDSFECAIHALAPRCGHCGCRVIGHGVDGDERTFCCSHCANQAGAPAASKTKRLTNH